MFRNEMDAAGIAPAASIYQRVLGDSFDALDPQLQAYFGPIPAGQEGHGIGTYDDAGLRVRALRPLFALLGRRAIAFPDHGTRVPFTVRNLDGPDGVRRSVRTFRFAAGTREMTDAMRASDGRLVDRIGIRGEIEIELALSVSAGGLRMESRRLALRVFGLRMPLPPLVTILLRETAVSDDTQRVELRLTAPVLGEIYGYSGTFTYAVRPCAPVGHCSVGASVGYSRAVPDTSANRVGQRTVQLASPSGTPAQFPTQAPTEEEAYG